MEEALTIKVNKTDWPVDMSQLLPPVTSCWHKELMREVSVMAEMEAMQEATAGTYEI